MRSDLIVDVGMFDGSDTKFYLDKGFRVLAIEASPSLAARARAALADAIESGHLSIVQVAVADHKGEIEFHDSALDGWGSVNEARAGSNLRVETAKVRVECDTLDSILGDETPYYIKIDVEGSDASCVRALERLRARPQFVSFECDPGARAETLELLDILRSCGYRRFKLVNQALNPSVRCPNPPLEGRFVDARFTHEMSGPFGEEAPGEWMDFDNVRDQFSRLSKQQSARSEYVTSGRVIGIPVGRFHTQLKAIYNARVVVAARKAYARLRHRELGGWFDIHAAL